MGQRASPALAKTQNNLNGLIVLHTAPDRPNPVPGGIRIADMSGDRK